MEQGLGLFKMRGQVPISYLFPHLHQSPFNF